MKSLALAASFLFLVSCGQQTEEKTTPEVTTVSISIPSVQCSMCETAITKALKGAEGVQETAVDLEAKTVSVTYLSASMNLSDLETTITKAGYDANDKKADPEAYENLPGCCKVPGADDDAPMKPMDSM